MSTGLTPTQAANLLADKNTSHLYHSVPQFIQDNDATNGYPLLGWISSFALLLTDLDVLMRDNYGNVTAPGWSQILDVNRCPDYALPWLGQLLGVRLQYNPNQTNAQMVASWKSAIQGHAGFQRGTVASIKSFVASTLTGLWQSSGSTTTVSSSEIIVLERTQTTADSLTGIRTSYTVEPYHLTVLAPTNKIPLLSYANLEAGLSVDNYSTLNGLYSTYGAFPNGATYTLVQLQNYQPAGFITYFGGY
jgi:hypothetical protein